MIPRFVVMHLVALPAFADNYIWMVHDGRQAVVIDPGDAAPVEAALESKGLGLAGILVTHHHHDHVGGVDRLRSRLAGRVFGPARETIPEPFEPLAHGARIDAIGLGFEVIDVPGHTAGHIAYFHPASADADGWLFCGDTLFSAGCGRLFEGTPSQMLESLDRLAALPDGTAVMCGHEYTESNLRFAAAVEPANRDVSDRLDWCREERAAGRPSLPSTIGRERRINPFLRCREPAVIGAARREGAPDDSDVAVFTALREWKNRFR